MKNVKRQMTNLRFCHLIGDPALLLTGGARGELRFVVISAARLGVRRTAARSRVRTSTFIPHLGRQATDPVLIQQVSERADGKSKQFSRIRLVAAGPLQSFENVGLLQL